MKNRSNEIRSNEICIRRELPVKLIKHPLLLLGGGCNQERAMIAQLKGQSKIISTHSVCRFVCVGEECKLCRVKVRQPTEPPFQN